MEPRRITSTRLLTEAGRIHRGDDVFLTVTDHGLKATETRMSSRLSMVQIV